MKALVLYRPNSEFARKTEEFVNNFKSRYPDKEIEVLDIDSRQGIVKAELYDVLANPSIMVLQNDGVLSRSWQGQHFPLIDELAAYMH